MRTCACMNLFISRVKHHTRTKISTIVIFTSTHLYFFTPSNLHTFTSTHVHIYTSSHHRKVWDLYIIYRVRHTRTRISTSYIRTWHTFTSTHLHFFTSSHLHLLHIYTCTQLHIYISTHLLIYTSYITSHTSSHTSSHHHTSHIIILSHHTSWDLANPSQVWDLANLGWVGNGWVFWVFRGFLWVFCFFFGFLWGVKLGQN